MVKKWLDSIEKQRRRIDLKEALQTNKQKAGRRLDSAPVSDFVALATKVGPVGRLRW